MIDHMTRRKVQLYIVAILFSLALLTVDIWQYRKNDTVDTPFNVLMIGDSQMAGFGWEGGYANCIGEVYPNAQVVNLAQSGSLMSSGEILSQWEYYIAQGAVMPDVVLVDGGINDLPYLRKEAFQNTGLPLVKHGLQTLIERIHETSPDTRIVYVLMPPFAEWKDSDDGPPSYDMQRNYWKQLHVVANAYDYVTVVDLFTLNPFQYPSADSYQKHLADSIHLNEAGYRKTFEYIQVVLTDHLNTWDA